VRRTVAVLAALILSVPAKEACAVDAFEIQVYDATANPPGVPGLELHLNDWATGHRTATPPEAPLHGQFHATLEPSLGVTPWWEIGAYWQMAVRTDDGVVDWAGAKLRSKFVTPPDWSAHWRLGINLELSFLPDTYEEGRWGSEVRPIVAWQNRNWLFALNPILTQPLAGPDASQGPSFEPAAKAARSFGPIALGVEYYGSLGPIASPLPLSRESQYVYEALDVLGIDRVELNFGVGEGLTPASAGVVLKAIVGYTFEPSTTPSPLAASNRRR
jgi:hypothetical protein